MTTEYAIRLDRDACEGVFACLVRDDRFLEAPDGLATIDEGRQEDGEDAEHEQFATFTDDRLENARQAARACPLEAIEVLTEDDDE